MSIADEFCEQRANRAQIESDILVRGIEVLELQQTMILGTFASIASRIDGIDVMSFGLRWVSQRRDTPSCRIVGRYGLPICIIGYHNIRILKCATKSNVRFEIVLQYKIM